MPCEGTTTPPCEINQPKFATHVRSPGVSWTPRVFKEMLAWLPEAARNREGRRKTLKQTKNIPPRPEDFVSPAAPHVLPLMDLS